MLGSCRVVMVIASSRWWWLSHNRRDRSLLLRSMVVVVGSPGVPNSRTPDVALMLFPQRSRTWWCSLNSRLSDVLFAVVFVRTHG